MIHSEVVEGHSRVDSKSWIEPFRGDMQTTPIPTALGEGLKAAVKVDALNFSSAESQGSPRKRELGFFAKTQSKSILFVDMLYDDIIIL